MVKRLIWSEKAKKNLVVILEFWTENNFSESYSKILGNKIRQTLLLICKNNFLGQETNYPNTRVTVCENYLLFYEIMEDSILVLSIFDGRRNPQEKLIK